MVLDTNTNEQRLYGGKQCDMAPKGENPEQPFHRDDVLSLAISADRSTVVTGESGKWPAVHVWDAVTCEKKCQFNLEKTARGVAALSLSPCGRYVATVDLSNDHKVTIYNIERQKQLLVMNGAQDRILDVDWSKRADDLRFATVSAKSVTFWHPADVTKRLKQPGVLGRQNAACAFTSLVFDEEGWCYTGGDNGQI